MVNGLDSGHHISVRAYTRKLWCQSAFQAGILQATFAQDESSRTHRGNVPHQGYPKRQNRAYGPGQSPCSERLNLQLWLLLLPGRRWDSVAQAIQLYKAGSCTPRYSKYCIPAALSGTFCKLTVLGADQRNCADKNKRQGTSLQIPPQFRS